MQSFSGLSPTPRFCTPVRRQASTHLCPQSATLHWQIRITTQHGWRFCIGFGAVLIICCSRSLEESPSGNQSHDSISTKPLAANKRQSLAVAGRHFCPHRSLGGIEQPDVCELHLQIYSCGDKSNYKVTWCRTFEERSGICASKYLPDKPVTDPCWKCIRDGKRRKQAFGALTGEIVSLPEGVEVEEVYESAKIQMPDKEGSEDSVYSGHASSNVGVGVPSFSARWSDEPADGADKAGTLVVQPATGKYGPWYTTVKAKNIIAKKQVPQPWSSEANAWIADRLEKYGNEFGHRISWDQLLEEYRARFDPAESRSKESLRCHVQGTPKLHEVYIKYALTPRKRKAEQLVQNEGEVEANQNLETRDDWIMDQLNEEDGLSRSRISLAELVRRYNLRYPGRNRNAHDMKGYIYGSSALKARWDYLGMRWK